MYMWVRVRPYRFKVVITQMHQLHNIVMLCSFMYVQYVTLPEHCPMMFSGCTFSVPNEVTEFTSPNYPNKYPSNSNCTWIIGQGIDLTKAKIIVLFDFFHTEGFGSPCR